MKPEIKDTELTKSEVLSEARIAGIVMEDIIFRSPAYGLAVALILGSLSYFFVWVVLNVLRPFILG